MSIYSQCFGGGMNPSITVKTTAGATVTVTLGMKSVTAIATGGTAKISAWNYGSYSVHAALGDAVGDATVDVVAVQDYNATLAQIKEVAEKSHGANYWSVAIRNKSPIFAMCTPAVLPAVATLIVRMGWLRLSRFDYN